MPIRSMTGFAQVRGHAAGDAARNPGNSVVEFAVSLKSVNHRFLDLHLRLPAGSDGVEVKLRRLLKQKLGRGHIEATLSLEHVGTAGLTINRELVEGYIRAFREAAREFQVASEPDLNAVLRIPGALNDSGGAPSGDAWEAAVLEAAERAIVQLDRMREEEGGTVERELRQRIQRLSSATAEVEKLRSGITRAQMEKLQRRLQELLGGTADTERVMQEAAILAERSDVEEEIVRMHAHVAHFLGLLDAGGEAGKKLDFLLQEMNREANTLLSKTAGLAAEGLRITELGLAMKAEIEKAREQAQNVE
jgi:uncharacterized protein (TIGR00255 family)